METIELQIGSHKRVEVLPQKDVNGRYMVTCIDCDLCAHHNDLAKAKADLGHCLCSPNCENCTALRRSCPTNPAVPTGGSCTDRLHVCPNDGVRWWQANTHFHLWQSVTDTAEWNHLRREKDDDHRRTVNGA